jgi:endonuclease YncB( thermonuclease family)
VIGAAALIAGWCSRFSVGLAKAEQQARATVLSIGDGDTIRTAGQQRLTVRLESFDGPEMAQDPDSNITQAVPEAPDALLQFDNQAPRLISGSPLGLGGVSDLASNQDLMEDAWNRTINITQNPVPISSWNAMIKPSPLAQMRVAPLLSFLIFTLLTPLAAAASTVISVGDGDTIRVDDSGKKITIRVACIDAPEMAQSPYGQKAREAFQDLLPIGSTVSLKIQTKDRYGRTVAEVFTQNGANAGLTLVQQGHAFAYRQYLKQCDAWVYLDREKLAERYRLGVWRSAGDIERPWDWRATRRGGESKPRQGPQRPVKLTIINGGARPSSGRRWYCRNVGSWEHAKQLLREGHTYLDGDSDGEACEALR